jgi:hypothetical protein
MCSNAASMRHSRTISWLLVAFGCASGPANTLAPGHEGAPGVERFLVCAPNTVIALPAELQDTTRTLHEQIDAYFEFQGRQAQWLDLYDSKQLWGEAMTAAKQQGGLERTPAFFARRLDEQYDFDAIVMPSLLLHQADGSMGTASWDGVKRRMRVLNAPRRRDVPTAGIEFAGMSGDLMVTSVHVMVFSRNGERIFEGRGGIEFVHEVDLAAFGKKRTLDVRVRGDLGQDVDALREGIAIAFAPYLTPPEE